MMVGLFAISVAFAFWAGVNASARDWVGFAACVTGAVTFFAWALLRIRH